MKKKSKKKDTKEKRKWKEKIWKIWKKKWNEMNCENVFQKNKNVTVKMKSMIDWKIQVSYYDCLIVFSDYVVMIVDLLLSWLFDNNRSSWVVC